MFNYKLAKQLKDAGFEYGNKLHTAIKKDNSPRLIGDNPDEEYILVPTLSSLIEACGKEFRKLQYFTIANNNGEIIEVDTWYADGRTSHHPVPIGNINDLNVTGKGTTPEEAVAKLWLELNKNEKQK